MSVKSGGVGLIHGLRNFDRGQRNFDQGLRTCFAVLEIKIRSVGSAKGLGEGLQKALERV